MATHGSNMRLPRSTPEAQGMSASAISTFLDDISEKIFYPNSFMLIRHGNVVAEAWWDPYGPDFPHSLYSLSKSFTSSAVGLAVHEGLLTIDDTVIDFFPDETPDEVSDNLAAMKVRHLLSMNTGHNEEPDGLLISPSDGNWARIFLAHPVEHVPGTYFVYNSAATYMLSAIVQKLTGQKIVDYLKPRLFDPLGIQNPTWQECPRGINTGGWGLSLKTEDIACFGQMLLQKGIFNGQQVLPAEWIELATSYHSDNSVTQENIDWMQGYGFQFWLCRHNAFRGDGAFGQWCVVMPEQDAVYAGTSGTNDLQGILDIIWDDLLPAMQEGVLPAEPQENSALKERLEALAIPARVGNLSSPLEDSLNGNKYRFEPNETKLSSMQLAFTNAACIVTLTDGFGDHSIECGRGKWTRGIMSLEAINGAMVTSDKVAASISWLDNDTLSINTYLYETPHGISFTCEFINDEVIVAPSMNVTFDDEVLPAFKGILAE